MLIITKKIQEMAKRFFGVVKETLFRCKNVDTSAGSVLATQLNRCLSTFDLTLLGIGSTLGSGVYILTGDIAKNVAGPGIVLSFLVAAFASVLSAFCYAEFGARIPRAGSAYVYTYVAVGELLGFTVGWNLLLEYIIGGASVARGLSAYFDSLLNHTIEKTMKETVGTISVLGSETYLDLVAFGICFLYTILLAFGVKNSTRFNNLCTLVNILVIVICVSTGAFYADTKNWKNFAPFGVQGVISGASSCFFAFIGFDVIATTGEEALQPSKSIPVSIVVTIVVCFLAYFGVSGVLTLMVPYHALTGDAAIAEAFKQKGLPVAQYIVTTGVLFGLSGTTLVSMIPVPRMLYSMAQDGLVFKFFSTVSSKTDVPLIATITTGIFTALTALVFDLEDLVEMVSIGTLLAYTLVVTSVLLLRYKKQAIGISKEDVSDTNPVQGQFLSDNSYAENELSFNSKEYPSHVEKIGSQFGSDSYENIDASTPQVDNSDNGMKNKPVEPTERSEMIVILAVTLLFVEIVGIVFILTFASNRLFEPDLAILLPCCFLIAVVIVTSIVIAVQPQNKQKLIFRTPLVPWLPLLAIFLNIYLLFGLRKLTWIRLGIWMAVGFAMYFFYGVRHSKVRQKAEYAEIPDSKISDTFRE